MLNDNFICVCTYIIIQSVLTEVFVRGIGNGEILFHGVVLIALVFFLKEFLNCLRIRVNNKLEQKVLFDLRKICTRNIEITHISL